jgi:hypothetical protein
LTGTDFRIRPTNDMGGFDVGFLILSVFCAGGIFAYGREALRFRRLLASGVVTRATVVRKARDDSGSESVVHYLVAYEFFDAQRDVVVHEKDLNSRAFFDSVAAGDQIEIVYDARHPGDSYPRSQVAKDLRLSLWICGGLAVAWLVLGMIV